MTMPDWDSMNERDFDLLLKNSLSETPPQYIVQEVTPWKKAIHRILWGLALQVITLNFLWLDYILPTMGLVWMLLGFRALQKENRWFRVCWGITIYKTLLKIFDLILNSTIYQEFLRNTVLFQILQTLTPLLMLLLFFCLWRGFLSVQRKAGLPPSANSAAAMILWYGILYILALTSYSGILLTIIMILCYILMLRSLFRLSETLDEAGYVVDTTPPLIPDWVVAAIIGMILAMGIAFGTLFCTDYPMEWNVKTSSDQTELSEIKAQLTDLGFPEPILDDLTDADILVCRDATQVAVVEDSYNVDGGDEDVLCITSIAVELSGETEQWKLFHHFRWIENPGFRGTECIQLWPAYRRSDHGWISAGDATGQLLYDDGGQTYTASYYSLDSTTYSYTSIFWGEQTSTDIFATFSLPNQGENHRGYVSYTIAEASDGWIVDSWINYCHQQTLLQYPATTAKEAMMQDITTGSVVFKTIQDALQFTPLEDAVDYLN